MMRRTTYSVTVESPVRPFDAALMALTLQWLQQWTFTPMEAEHLMVIIRAQTQRKQSASKDSGGLLVEAGS